MNPRLVGVSTLGVFLCVAASAAAQGNGNAYGKNKNNKPPVTSTSDSTSSASGPSAAAEFGGTIPGTGIRNFGAWLDDASMMTPGQGYVGFGFGFWKMPGYREVDIPTIDAGYGVHKRVQVGASLPFYHASEPGGPMASGMGTLYLNAKIQLRDPSNGGPGFSVTPAIEVLSTAPVGGDRFSVALPVSIELQRTGWRAYGSTGYFSRGALFASGAIEKTLTERVWITGSLTHAYSMDPDPLSVALGLSQTHTDVNGGVAFIVRDGIAAYSSLGRTISKKDANSAELMFSAGVSFSFLQ
jgi:hypothetical protein